MQCTQHEANETHVLTIPSADGYSRRTNSGSWPRRIGCSAGIKSIKAHTTRNTRSHDWASVSSTLAQLALHCSTLVAQTSHTHSIWFRAALSPSSRSLCRAIFWDIPSWPNRVRRLCGLVRFVAACTQCRRCCCLTLSLLYLFLCRPARSGPGGLRAGERDGHLYSWRSVYSDNTG